MNNNVDADVSVDFENDAKACSGEDVSNEGFDLEMEAYDNFNLDDNVADEVDADVYMDVGDKVEADSNFDGTIYVVVGTVANLDVGDDAEIKVDVDSAGVVVVVGDGGINVDVCPIDENWGNETNVLVSAPVVLELGICSIVLRMSVLRNVFNVVSKDIETLRRDVFATKLCIVSFVIGFDVVEEFVPRGQQNPSVKIQ